MGNKTKISLNNDKIQQESNDVLNLSGTTEFYGSVLFKSGNTINIQENKGDGNVLTSDSEGNLSLEPLPNIENISKIITQDNHNFIVGDVIGWSGNTYNKPIADGSYDGEILGIVSQVIDSNKFKIIFSGYIDTLSDLITNTTYFLSDGVSGELTSTQPTTHGHISKTMLITDSVGSGWVLPYIGYVINTGDTISAVVDGINIGIGEGVFKDVQDTEMRFRSLVGSGDTSVSTSGDTIIIHSESDGGSMTFSGLTDTPSTYEEGKWLKVSGNSIVYVDEPMLEGITGVTNIGIGEEIYSSISNNNIQLRTLVGSGDTSVSTSGDTIIIHSLNDFEGNTDISISQTTSDVSVNSSTGSDGVISGATTLLAGVMTSADKTKLDGIEEGAEPNVGTDLNIGSNTGTVVRIDSSTGNNVELPIASSSNAGIITNSSQTFDGTKTTTIWCGTGCVRGNLLVSDTDVRITDDILFDGKVDNTNNIGYSIPTQNIGNTLIIKSQTGDDGGGDLEILGGDGSSTANGGDIIMTSGCGSTGGLVDIRGGNGNPNSGGNVYMIGGEGCAAGGDVYMSGGQGGTNNGGDVNICGGESYSGIGGDVNIIAGQGGNVYIKCEANTRLSLTNDGICVDNTYYGDNLYLNTNSGTGLQSAIVVREFNNPMSASTGQIALNSLSMDVRQNATNTGCGVGIKFTIGCADTYTGTGAIVAERTGSWSQGKLHFAVQDAGVSGKETMPIMMTLDGPNAETVLNADLCLGSYCGFATDWVATSDARLKTDLEPISNALSTIMNLKGYCYKLCNDISKQTRIGMIAQEVDRFVPEMVSRSRPNSDDIKLGINDYRYGLKYDNLTSILVEAIKEQQNQINHLKNRINKLSKIIKL